MTCETCRFWDRAEWTDSVGRCRRYAPTTPDPWPETDASDWCGEWDGHDGTMLFTPEPRPEAN